MSVPSPPWLARIRNFTSTIHTHPSPSTNPSNIILPPNYNVCIIGASRGIGASIAESYAKAGAGHIIIAARNPRQLEETFASVKRTKPSVSIDKYECDITSDIDIARLASAIGDASLDAVIIPAGYAGPTDLLVTEGDPLHFQRNMDVNTVGVYHVAHHLIPLLLRNRKAGKAPLFVAVNSMGALGTSGPTAITAYHVSKFAQIKLVEMIGAQFADQGLTAVTLHPGGVLTEFAKGIPEDFKKYMVDDVSLCGSFCLWLSSRGKEVSWLNGRFLSSKWDVDELVQKKNEVVESDMFKPQLSIA